MHGRYFLITGTLLFMVTLQGCKHPLAIVGDGDIVDVTGSGRGCTLEQFRAQDKACTDNEVSRKYSVNYQAVPRPGWRFVRWEGPCAVQSPFQHCSFDVSGKDVAQWDETYPEVAIQPSTAVFQPITGETGTLLAGTPVAGVAYETQTQQGVTGLDGSFQYEAGETVRFMIGATVLGEVVGGEEVTPFDLAGSPVETGIHITWALRDRNGPFHTVINIAVLLHSLDNDGDPDNGIEISAGVASLLKRVALNLRKPWDGGGALIDDFDESFQPWLTFQRDPTFRHLLARSRRQQRFSETHGIVDPATAMAGLYRELGIEPQPVGLSLLQNSQPGYPDQFETLYYDPNGNFSRHENTVYPDAYEIWQYNDRNQVTMHELQGPGGASPQLDTWQYDAFGNLTMFDTNERFDTRTYLYDDDDNPARESRTVNNGKNINTLDFEYKYAKFGRLKRFTARETEGFENWRFNTMGKVIRREDQSGNRESWDYAANGKLIQSENSNFGLETYDYDAAGRLIRSEQQDTWCDHGCYRLATTWEYDDDGRVTVRQLLNLEDNSVMEVDTWRYDASGRVVSRTGEPLSGDNQVKEIWQYYPNGVTERHTLRDGNTFLEDLYDPDGNLIREMLNDDGNRSTKTWDYDAEGNLIYYGLDLGSNGTVDESTAYQYVSTGWAHLFSGIQVYGQPYLPPIKPVPAHEEPPPNNTCRYQGIVSEINNC